METNEHGTPKESKESIFSVSGYPRVPGVVRAYGTIIIVLNVVVMILTVFGTAISIIQTKSPFPIIGGIIQFAIAIVMYRIGVGLRDGERSAVYGICVLGGLAILFALGLVVWASSVASLILIGVVIVIYLPPVISAFRHWDCFE